jgi:hypothetical protein
VCGIPLNDGCFWKIFLSNKEKKSQENWNKERYTGKGSEENIEREKALEPPSLKLVIKYCTKVA